MIHVVTLKAAKLHMDRLRVQPVRGNLSLDKNGGKDFKQLCSDALAHPDHLALGVENAAFALFLSLTRAREHPRICTKNDQRRPTSALIKVNPREPRHTRYYVRLSAHDIGHGLGFYLPEFKEHKILKETRLQCGRVILYLQSDILREKGEEHFGCQTMDSVELEGRDEGYFFEDFHFHSHWKRRYAKDELMSTDFDRPSGMYYTVLTLAAFDSLPFCQADSTLRPKKLRSIPRGMMPGFPMLLPTPNACSRGRKHLSAEHNTHAGTPQRFTWLTGMFLRRPMRFENSSFPMHHLRRTYRLSHRRPDQYLR
ncbi:Peptidase M8 [Trypanosoma melophagium]|uniref:Peptidase M8 n=1 Tax=Trypanosoma melophagium TaxID=715481 RepID=UPI00351A70FB|nr:Peptidase M8 [Trypanosoma melophagium]